MMKSPVLENKHPAGVHSVAVSPLFMVSNLIEERESYRNDVENTLRQSTSGPQNWSAR